MGRILVTGAAGFIGYHVCSRLLADRCEVVGLDNMNPYYDVALKEARRDRLLASSRFSFVRGDIRDVDTVQELFSRWEPRWVIHLAAQAGVRASHVAAQVYVDTNITGFWHVLEACQRHRVDHLVFASSSSVYGASTKMPYSEGDTTDHPLSLYAATKKANEMMAHSVSHTSGLAVTGLRFFTAYGPWGRPDMSYYRFAMAMLHNRPIDLYAHGQQRRDFTEVGDISQGVVQVLRRIPTPDTHWSGDAPRPDRSLAPYALFNIGNHDPIEVNDIVTLLEEFLQTKATRRLLPRQPQDVEATWADVDSLQAAIGWRPTTPIRDGMAQFAAWFLGWHAPDGRQS